ncbi:DsbA family protein [Pseudaeromonas sharmana]|uniref:DsbA family protein n=1 Tax=Pseudaeromonas sharmana TaxID=328412 RepID=A0ABV8CNK5_9GAMM
MKISHRLLPALACLAPLAFPVHAAELERQDVEKIVHDYLLAHPELLIDMSNALRAKQESQQQEADVQLIKAHHDALFADKRDPVAGNEKGSVNVIVFFDYNCGYCKRATPMIDTLLHDNKKVRLVYKEFPILSETSYIAAKAALAVNSLHPDKYSAFHAALMAHQGALSSDKDLAVIAKKADLNWPAIEKKMQDPTIEKQLLETRQLAEKLGLTGTPAFVIGDQILRGAPRTTDDLKALINDVK